MSKPGLQLAHAPIVEAIIDIDCDMPPGFDIDALEAPAREIFQPQYPLKRRKYSQLFKIEQRSEEMPAVHSAQPALEALQYLRNDEKQLVQVRMQGYSFNRLAPYTSLDDYLPEIQRTWNLFVRLAMPIRIRAVRLRYINCILLPGKNG